MSDEFQINLASGQTIFLTIQNIALKQKGNSKIVRKQNRWI